ncbi:MAG: hypothetical protein HRT57_08925 [Crocinitomicaceae bacterium]|nr:hypothetical protein [Crocinitomicaceae bacterium]
MIYKELIQALKKVKTYDDISEELLTELSSVTIDTHMQLYLSEDETEPEQAFEMTRMSILKMLDFTMLDIVTSEEPEEYGDMPNINDLPFGDPLLKNQLSKAFEEYNKRMDS